MDGLTFLEYVESNGTQYIMTDVVPDSSWGFYADYTCKSIDGDNWCLFGARLSSGLRDYQLTSYYDGTMRPGSSSTAVQFEMTVGVRQQVDFSDHVFRKPDGTTVVLQKTYDEAPCPAAVFGLNQNGSVVQKGKFRLYHLAFFSQGEEHWYLPAAHDGIAGLYDVANDAFLTPNRTLVAGPAASGGGCLYA